MKKQYKLNVYLALRQLASFKSIRKFNIPLSIAYIKKGNESDKAISNKLDWYLPIVKVITIRENFKFDLIPDLLFIGNHSYYLHPRLFKLIGNSFPVDNSFYDHFEISNWVYSYYSTLDKAIKQKFNKRSFDNFKNFSKQKKSNKAYLFGSGPSIEEYNKYEIDNNAWKIICNSLVKNIQFINDIKVDAITIADPVFHFGHSKYAIAFRKDLINRWHENKFYIFLPEVNLPFFLRHYPFLEYHLIGVQNSNKIKKLSNHGEISVFPTENILSYLMLPLGFQLAKNLFLIGFDGKSNKEEADYFWDHQQEFQYLDLIADAKIEHPAFFEDRSFVGYYEKHCSTLDLYIQFATEKNIEVQSLTRSFIPCFAPSQSKIE